MTVSLDIRVRQPFDFNWLCRFFASRSIDGLEAVTANSYARVVTLRSSHNESAGLAAVTGWFSVEEAKANNRHSTLRLQLSPELEPVADEAVRLAGSLFDTDARPADWLPTLGELGQARPGLRVPGTGSGFELAVRAVLGQQITVKAARTLAQRFVQKFGEAYKPQQATVADRQRRTDPAANHSTQPPLRFAFPTPARIARARKDTIARLGIIGRRADTIRALAKAIDAGELVLQPGADAEDVIRQLVGMPGIGDWTAHYIAMRALRYADAFPAADYGVMKALQVDKPRAARDAAAQWQPYRAIAVMHLWASLADATDS